VPNSTANGVAGTANTGGGGGGAGYQSSPAGDQDGGAGGSGIVILRRAGSYTAGATTGSPTRTESGGFTYYVWTGSGSITI
jgi:hypothetical protein